MMLSLVAVSADTAGCRPPSAHPPHRAQPARGARPADRARFGEGFCTRYRAAGIIAARQVVDLWPRWNRRPEATDPKWDVVRYGPLGLIVLAQRVDGDAA